MLPVNLFINPDQLDPRAQLDKRMAFVYDRLPRSTFPNSQGLVFLGRWAEFWP